ncbi:MAG: hypothetical protein DELT_01278 [Desulfovibrio sp.]
MTLLSLQETVEPNGACFGCGTTNMRGLRLKSYPDPDGIHVTATITPEEYHCGWPGLVYGGFIAMAADCHCNWTCIYSHYLAEGREPGSLPAINCATGKLELTYRKPTPMGVPLTLKARVAGPVRRQTRILCDVFAEDILTVSVDAIFARVDAVKLAAMARKG